MGLLVEENEQLEARSDHDDSDSQRESVEPPAAERSWAIRSGT
jgi:hypothetical protein